MKNSISLYPALVENNYALECLEQSIEALASQYDLQQAKREIAILMNSFALIYEKFNENAKALVCSSECYNKILKCEKSKEQQADLQIINNNIGQLHFKLFHFSESIDFITQSIDLMKAQEQEINYKELGFQIQLLALAYLQVGNIEKSQELRNLSLQYSQQIQETNKI